MSEKWIAGAIKHKGALHKQLGVPEGKKIPAKKLHKAAEKGGKLGKRARLAETLGKMHHGADTVHHGIGLQLPLGHGMQMGPSGFGLTHGMYDDGDEGEDNSHEFKKC